jgi:hypothetical protein
MHSVPGFRDEASSTDSEAYVRWGHFAWRLRNVWTWRAGRLERSVCSESAAGAKVQREKQRRAGSMDLHGECMTRTGVRREYGAAAAYLRGVWRYSLLGQSGLARAL